MKKKFTQVFLVLVAAMLVILATSPADVQASRKKMGIVSPHKTYLGKTYGEWAASWWQAAFALPVDNGEHPILNGGSFGGDDGVVFLAAVVGASAEIDVTIPAGTPLFVPIINAE